MNLNSKDLNASRRKISEGFHDLFEGVEEMLRASGRQVRREADDSQDRVGHRVEQVREWADDMGTTVRRGYHEVAGTAQTYVKSHPGTVAGIAAAVAGVVIACLLTQRR